MNNVSIGEQLPKTLQDVRDELNELRKRVQLLEKIEECMNSYGRPPWFEAIIPTNDMSQETVRVSGGDLETVVNEVVEEWDIKHPNTRASRAGIYVYLIVEGQDVAISPKDAPNGLQITYIKEDRSQRKRAVWSPEDRSCSWPT